MNFFEQVYATVKKVPAGKVTTYGEIARALNTQDARKVGWALHGNHNPQIPCHRVVSKDGKIAANYSMGDWREQKRKLLTEKVIFADEMHVDLKKCSISL